MWHGKLCTWKGWGNIVRAQNKGIFAFLIGLVHLFSRSPSRSQWIPKVFSGRNSEISQIPDPENLFGNSRLAIFLLKVSTFSNKSFQCRDQASLCNIAGKLHFPGHITDNTLICNLPLLSQRFKYILPLTSSLPLAKSHKPSAFFWVGEGAGGTMCVSWAMWKCLLSLMLETLYWCVVCHFCIVLSKITETSRGLLLEWRLGWRVSTSGKLSRVRVDNWAEQGRITLYFNLNMFRFLPKIL